VKDGAAEKLRTNYPESFVQNIQFISISKKPKKIIILKKTQIPLKLLYDATRACD
jgi:hypothetical protein